jgi:hypothetical protein
LPTGYSLELLAKSIIHDQLFFFARHDLNLL